MPDPKPFDQSHYREPLVALSEALRKNKLILVVGAGLSSGSGLETWEEIVHQLRNDLNLPAPGESTDPRLTDPLYVAEMYEQEFGKPALRTKITKPFRKRADPSEAHLAIAESDVSTIFTTNYDTLLEDAFRKCAKPYAVLSRDSDYSYLPDDQEALIVKLHGDVNSPSEIVITMSDVFDYERTHPNMREGLRDKLKTRTALFVGVSLLDRNLEQIFEQALREVYGHGSRHFILVKDWDERLKQYYRLHGLSPVVMDSWDHVAPFIRLIREWADRPPKVAGLSYDSRIDLQSGPGSPLFKAARRGIKEKYNNIFRRFKQGCRASIREEAEALWNEIKDLHDKGFLEVKVKVLMLRARIALQTPGYTDRDGARQHVAAAVKIAGDSLNEEIRFVEALLEYFDGKVDSALDKLESLSGDAALTLRLGILVASRRLDESCALIRERSKKPGTDEPWDVAVAEYFLESTDYESAETRLRKWVKKKRPSASTLELAGFVHALSSQHEHREFCRKYHLFENLGFILNHGEMIADEERKAAAKFFLKAARLFVDMGERERGRHCLRNFYKVRIDDDSIPPGTLREGVRLAEILNDSLARTLDSCSEERRLAEVKFKDLQDALDHSDYLPHILLKMKNWALLNDRAREVAEYLDLEEFRRKLDRLEEQAASAFCLVELWTEAGEHGKALDAIDRFVPPPEYAHYSGLLQLAYHVGKKDDSSADATFTKLRSDYPDNPIMMALACEKHERDGNWQLMHETATQLVEIVAIPQTFDYLLTSLGKLERWEELLQELNRADLRNVRLSPLWTVLNRARALFADDQSKKALSYFQQAEELARKGEITLRPSDFYHQAIAYKRIGERDSALYRARELVNKFPEFPDGYLALIQLLTEDPHRQQEAFKIAQEASERFPDDDRIMAMYVHAGVLSGHDDEVAPHLREFHQRFPDSRAMRSISKEEVLEELRKADEYSNWLSEMYHSGRMPVLPAVYGGPGSHSYFRFRATCIRARLPQFISSGEQLDDWRRLTDDSARSNGVAIDLPALMTAFEFGVEMLRSSWMECMRMAFPKAYVPNSIQTLLELERSNLMGGQQAGRYESLKRLRDSLVHLHTIAVLPREPNLRASNGEEEERRYAKEHRLFYLNEYGDEKDRISGEFGFQELAILLSGSGAITPAQQVRLERLARDDRKFIGLPRSSSKKREIVADMATLKTLATQDLLRAVEHFDKIYVSEEGRQLLQSEIAAFEFTEDVISHLKGFELYLEDNKEWIEWVEISESERRAIWPGKAKLLSEESVAWDCFVDLFVVARKKKCGVITDDRFTRVMQFNKMEDEDPMHKTRRIGSDSLLRFFYYSGMMDRGPFIDHYQKLIDWNYLHMPPEPDYLVDMMPVDGSDGSKLFERALAYYRESFTDFIDAAQHEEILAGLRNEATACYNRGLATTIRKAHDAGKSVEAAARLMRSLGLCFLVDPHRAKVTYYLAALCPYIVATEEDSSVADSGFAEWYDKTLQRSGILEVQIDLSWLHYIEHVLQAPVPELSEAETNKLKALLVGVALWYAGERSFAYVIESPVGATLQNEYGFEFKSDLSHTFRFPDGGQRVSVSLSESEIEKAFVEHVVGSLPSGGKREYRIRDMIIESARKSADSFLAEVQIYPAHPAFPSEGSKRIRRLMNIASLFTSSDKRLRQEAWETGRSKLTLFGRPLDKWDRLRKDLLAPDEETWQEAARQCAAFLMSSADIAADILSDVADGGPELFEETLGQLRPEDVLEWFPSFPPSLDSEESLLNWAERLSSTRRSAEWDDWQPILDIVFFSLFPDVGVVRKRLARQLEKEDKAPILQFVHRLFDKASKIHSPVFAINAVLLFLELTGPKSGLDSRLIQELWQTSPMPDRYPPTHARASELLRCALGQPVLLPEGTEQSTDEVLNEDLDWESEILSLPFEWSRAFSLLWEKPEEDLTQVNRRRYAAAIAGSVLTAKLTERNRLQTAKECRRLRKTLRSVNAMPVAEGKRLRLDTHSGFFRPYLATYLSYPVCFAVKALMRYTKAVRTYLLSEAIRAQLLQMGGIHKLFHALLGGEETLKPQWIDGSLVTTQSAEIDTFLRTCTGDAIKDWISKERQLLDTLETRLDADEELGAQFRRIADLPKNLLEDHCLVLLHMLWLGVLTDRKGWEQWTRRWFESPVIDRVAVAPRFYSFLCTNLSQVVLLKDTSKKTKEFLESQFLKPPDELISVGQLLGHLSALWSLLLGKWYHSFFGQWLTAFATDSSVTEDTRREFLRRVTREFHMLPPKTQMSLTTVLQKLAERPEMVEGAGLDRFKERA